MTFNKCKCLNCGFEFEFESASEDELGWHTTCPECLSSFDVDINDYLPSGVKAVWEYKNKRILTCSNCGAVKPYEVSLSNPDELFYWNCKYCPNCGKRVGSSNTSFNGNTQVSE